MAYMACSCAQQVQVHTQETWVGTADRECCYTLCQSQNLMQIRQKRAYAWQLAAHVSAFYSVDCLCITCPELTVLLSILVLNDHDYDFCLRQWQREKFLSFSLSLMETAWHSQASLCCSLHILSQYILHITVYYTSTSYAYAIDIKAHTC